MKWKINNIELNESNLTNLIKQNLKELLLNSDLSSSESENTQSQQSNISDGEIFVITRKHDLFLYFIDKIKESKLKKQYLVKLKNSLTKDSKEKEV